MLFGIMVLSVWQGPRGGLSTVAHRGEPNRKACSILPIKIGRASPTLSCYCCTAMTTTYLICGGRFWTFKPWTPRWEGSSAALRGRGTATLSPAGHSRCGRLCLATKEPEPRIN